MADYPVNAPFSLDNLDLTTPDGIEDAAKLDDSIRQMKSLVVNTFLLEHNADGSHKGISASLDTNSVTGDKIQQSASDDSQRAIGTNHVKDGSITAPKLAAGAITNMLIAAASIDDAKYADNSIATAKLKDLQITTAKIAVGAVTADRIAAGVITGDKVASETLTASNIKTNEIGPDRLKLTENYIPVGGANGVIECLVGGNVTMTIDESTVPPTARFVVSTGESVTPVAILQETGFAAGDAVANTWVSRPPVGANASSNFSILINNGDLIAIVGVRTIQIKKKGTYLVSGFANARQINWSQARIQDVTSNITLLSSSVMYSPVAGSEVSCQFLGILNIVDDNTNVELQQYSALSGLNAYGVSLSGIRGIFATLQFIKVS